VDVERSSSEPFELYVALVTMATLQCEECGREMAVEFRIPRPGAPGQCHDFYSCECGFVTPQEHADSHALQMAEREVGRYGCGWMRLDREFLKWARLANKVTAPPTPPKLVE
jgi:hypothetical protein